MDRRESIKAMIAGGLALATAPLAAQIETAKPDNWHPPAFPNDYWKEKPLDFEGLKGTEFLWPCDRPIIFKYASCFPPNPNMYRSPTFGFHPLKVSLFPIKEEVFRFADVLVSKGRSHLHLVFIEGHPELYAYQFVEVKLVPVTDFFGAGLC